ncbi:hypothetical protein LZ31DRAFT_577614 [Colletotrichum somersetense]|nr:hypothetical protein LZ31DRAFT_577614 [Colletotrichum somersetense]
MHIQGRYAYKITSMASNGHTSSGADDAHMLHHHVISGHDADDAEVYDIIMSVMHILNDHNLKSQLVTKKMVRSFAEDVFDDWDTDKPIPVPPDDEPPLLHLDQSRLRLSTIKTDSPSLIPKSPPLVPLQDDKTEASAAEAPTHRRQGQPAFLRVLPAGLEPYDFGVGWAWTDLLGAKLPWQDVRIDRGLAWQTAYDFAQVYHDMNEHKLIVKYNTDRAVYWARQRLFNFARELNGENSLENGNRYRCADEDRHPLYRALLCRHVMEELAGNEEREPMFLPGKTTWAWVDRRSFTIECEGEDE